MDDLPPHKILAQWKLDRTLNPHPHPQSFQDSAQEHPHHVNLLRNRRPDLPLGPFDGNVAAYAQLGAQHYFITTNTDYVPTLPSLETPHRVYLRSDMRYGTDDPTLWPQQWTDHYCYMPLIATRSSRPDLEPM